MGDSSLFSSSSSSSSFSGSCSFLGSPDAESDLCDSSTLSWPGRGTPRFFCELVSGEEANLGRRRPRRRHFLDACFLCKRPIRGASDVFMYGGDAPFCSEECRQEQMGMDEALERCRHLPSSSSSSTMMHAAARKWRHPHFLDACFLCKRPIRGVSNVFMYGGDAPFCSEECREEQVEMDEALERCRRLPSSSSMTHAAPSASTSVPPLPALMCGTATSIALLLPTSVAS